MANERLTPRAASDRDRFSADLYDRIAPAYDAINSDMSVGADDRWRRRALALVPLRSDFRAVDFGTGTGEFYLLLRRQNGPQGSVVGFDRSTGMLAVAQAKAFEQMPDLPHDLRPLDSYDTELPDNSVDLITLGWVLRSMGDRSSFYREALRILRPGGTLLSLEAFAPGFWPLRLAHDAWMRVFMDRRIRRHTNNDRSLYRFVFSENHFPTKRALVREWCEHGFTNVGVRRLAVGIAAHRGDKPAA